MNIRSDAAVTSAVLHQDTDADVDKKVLMFYIITIYRQQPLIK